MMKRIRQLLLILGLFLSIIILFRNWIYRQCVTYRSIGLRQNYVAKDDKLIDFIEKNACSDSNPTIEYIVNSSLVATSKQLNFTSHNNENDPNKLIYTQEAHCVGYAAFFAATCNYLLQKYKLDKQWTAKPQIGQLYLFGTNVHQYLKTPFFKDHDFVIIENKETNRIFAVDPTVNDYCSIDFVTLSKK